MKLKTPVLIFLVSTLFLVGTTFVTYTIFNNKNVGELPINAPESSMNSNYKIYKRDEIKFQDLRCVSKKTYEKIAEICISKDFMGSFKPINLKGDLLYREQYLKVLKGEESYINRLEEKGYSDLVEFDPENIKEYTYYFFDMNGDGVPELIAFGNNMRYSHIFSYNTQINKIELFNIERTGNSFFLGGNKLGAWYNGTGLTYEFYEIEENGNRNSKIFFHSEGYLNDITKEEEAVYMVGFGEGSEEIENFKLLAKVMGEQLFEENSTYFLRITKEQYEQVTQNYFSSRKGAEENIKMVTYTFEELFGELK